MRVMHVTFDMRIGGTEMVIKNIIEGNTDANIEMSIFCIEAPLGPWGEELKAAGIKTTTHERQPGFDTKLIGAIRKHIKENAIDILHCHQYTPWVYGALAAAFTKTKVIFTEHGRFYPDSSSLKRKVINPLLLNLTDRVTAISKSTKQSLVNYEFIPEHSIQVIYNGIAPLIVKVSKEERKSELSISESTFVFGTIARLDPIKNQIMMIKAFASITSKLENATLVIVGDGEMMEPLRILVDDLEITDKVKFTGYIPNPTSTLNVFDVFLLSSLSEGTSMTLLEAMSLGKPCIVTDAGGNAEVITHNVNGLVSRNNDLMGFAENMNKVTTKSYIQTFSHNAVKLFNEKFNVLIMQEGYQTIYRELLNNA